MKLLILQHVPHEHPGYITEYAQKKKIELDIIELWKPYSLPQIENYDGMVILGGPMGVYEAFPSKTDEVKVIQSALGHIPILGICLGSQLLAYALGAQVHPNIKDGKRLKEVGYFMVDLTEKEKVAPILKGFNSPVKVLQWHGDVFELPKGAELLATSSVSENQAFSSQNAHGFLFHFEFTPEMVAKQIEVDKEWMHADNEIDEELLLKEARESAGLMRKQCFQLLDNFLGASSNS